MTGPWIIGTIIGAFALNKVLKGLDAEPVTMMRTTVPETIVPIPTEATVPISVPAEPVPTPTKTVVKPATKPLRPVITQRSPAKVAKPDDRRTNVRKGSTPTKTTIVDAIKSRTSNLSLPVAKPKTKSSSKTSTKSPVKTAPKPTRVIKPTVTRKSVAKVAKPRTSPEQQAAMALDKYLRAGGKSRYTVKIYQKRMGKLAVDGIPGPLTYKRAVALYSGASSKGPWPMQKASEDLRKYYKGGGRSKSTIKNYQARMGELVVDGLVGPKTKSRYATLTGKLFG